MCLRKQLLFPNHFIFVQQILFTKEICSYCILSSVHTIYIHAKLQVAD